jgi:hypothetical protein
MWDEDIVNFIANNLQSGTDFLDIGANIGLITLGVIKKANLKNKQINKIHCFECDTQTFNILLKNTINFNNISYYQANDLQQLQSIITRPWQRVLVEGETTYDWQYWDDSFIWEDVLIIGESEIYGVNPSDVYQTYLGTNKIIFDDSQGLSIDPEQILMYIDIDWQSSIKIPT